MGIYQARILGEELIKSGYLKEENITVKDTAEIVNPLEIIAKEKVGGESTTENINIFCASTMNRAQHTVLELIYAMNVTNNLENPQEPEEEVKKRRPSVKNNFADPDVKYYIDLLSLERFFTDFAVSRLIRKSGGIKNFEKNIQKLAKWSKNFENETIKQKLIPEGKDEKQYLKEILDGISQQSVLKWQNGEFCRDFTKKYKKKTPKIGGKKTRRRKKRTKNRTKKKRRKKRKS